MAAEPEVGGQFRRAEVGAATVKVAVLVAAAGGQFNTRPAATRRQARLVGSVQEQPQPVGVGAGKVVAVQVDRSERVEVPTALLYTRTLDVYS